MVIVTDLDNTLLRSDKFISDYTIDVLHKCRARGHTIIFATARSTQAAASYIKQFQPDVFIGYGGSLATDTNGQVIHRLDIAPDISKALIDRCMLTPEILAIHAINEDIALANLKGSVEADFSHYSYTDFTDSAYQSFLKISVDSNSREVVDHIAKDFPMCDLLHYTGETLSRFANKDAVKWNALKSVAAHLSIDTKDFVAFGDDYNDMGMISGCGIGVAVANAIEDIKSVANFECDSNDNDGVAKWIEQNILRQQMCD